jgi:hypothetical protein
MKHLKIKLETGPMYFLHQMSPEPNAASFETLSMVVWILSGVVEVEPALPHEAHLADQQT